MKITQSHFQNKIQVHKKFIKFTCFIFLFMYLVYLHFRNILLHMKKYIIPFTLVFTTSLFVWNAQRVDTNEEIFQTENSDRSIAELEKANPTQFEDLVVSPTVSVNKLLENQTTLLIHK